MQPMQGSSYSHPTSASFALSGTGLQRNASAAALEEDVDRLLQHFDSNDEAWSFPGSSAPMTGFSFNRDPRPRSSTVAQHAFGSNMNGPSQPMNDAISSVPFGSSTSAAPMSKQSATSQEYGEEEIIADVYGVLGDMHVSQPVAGSRETIDKLQYAMYHQALKVDQSLPFSSLQAFEDSITALQNIGAFPKTVVCQKQGPVTHSTELRDRSNLSALADPPLLNIPLGEHMLELLRLGSRATGHVYELIMLTYDGRYDTNHVVAIPAHQGVISTHTVLIFRALQFDVSPNGYRELFAGFISSTPANYSPALAPAPAALQTSIYHEGSTPDLPLESETGSVTQLDSPLAPSPKGKATKTRRKHGKMPKGTHLASAEPYDHIKDEDLFSGVIDSEEIFGFLALRIGLKCGTNQEIEAKINRLRVENEDRHPFIGNFFAQRLKACHKKRANDDKAAYDKITAEYDRLRYGNKQRPCRSNLGQNKIGANLTQKTIKKRSKKSTKQ